MKRVVWVLACMGALGLGGCIVIMGGCVVVGGEPCPPPDRCGDGDATIAEIDATRTLMADSAKADIYLGIAKRDGLDCGAQVHLVKESCRRLMSDSAKEQVMLAVIANPGFCPPAKKAVLDSLSHLMADSAKSRVLAAMSAKAAAPQP